MDIVKNDSSLVGLVMDDIRVFGVETKPQGIKVNDIHHPSFVYNKDSKVGVHLYSLYVTEMVTY